MACKPHTLPATFCSDLLSSLLGQKELHLRMLEKRGFVRIEEGFAFQEKRGTQR
jgi:hypothetical protein